MGFLFLKTTAEAGVYAYGAAFIVVPIALFSIVLIMRSRNENCMGIIISFILCLTVAYLIYFIFPVSVISFKGIPEQIYNSDLANKLVKSSYQRINPWNAFPSLHVATGFFPLLALNKYIIKHKYIVWIYGVWFFIMMLGALTLQYHSLADVIAGFILAILGFKFSMIYGEKINSKYCSYMPLVRILIWLIMVVVVFIILYLSKIYGFNLHTIPK